MQHPVPIPQLNLSGASVEDALLQAATAATGIIRDDAALRKAGPGAGFVTLRKNYPLRREFRYITVVPTGADPQLLKMLSTLGFSVAHASA